MGCGVLFGSDQVGSHQVGSDRPHSRHTRVGLSLCHGVAPRKWPTSECKRALNVQRGFMEPHLECITCLGRDAFCVLAFVGAFLARFAAGIHDVTAIRRNVRSPIRTVPALIVGIV